MAGLTLICKKLSGDLHFKGDAKWMAAHSGLLLLTLASFIISYIKKKHDNGSSLTPQVLFLVFNSLV
jgi:hypothetical protein